MLLVNGVTTPHSVEEKDRENQWYRLIFNLGMRGFTPIPSEIETIRIEGSTAKITTEFYRMIKIHFKFIQCLFFHYYLNHSFYQFYFD